MDNEQALAAETARILKVGCPHCASKVRELRSTDMGSALWCGSCRKFIRYAKEDA